jgi:dTDP-4-dehydrorhamnose reductase
MGAVEWWGGAECTMNRVGDRYFEQLKRTGHAFRLHDLDRMADLGLRRVRFPILWEQHWQPGRAYDFTWADARMERLRELGVDPIVGLVHHGSGPAHTDLLSASFAEGLADFAREVAQRYPWVTYFTPVNEPLTTARFSGLYGHWYPHARNDASFVQMLLTQVRAIQQSMAAIREVIPHAQLVQTEDLGTAFSTPLLKYQAEFENHRRWLSWDLLFGRVQPLHPLYRYLVDVAKVCPTELARINAGNCRPDIVGINYYVTSDRFLDEHVEVYPSWTIGSNSRHTYADVEAVRVLPAGIVGHGAVLAEVWRRYATPVALTEVHLGCSEEHQVSWLVEAWAAARQARADGIDVRAVSAWSLFGAFDWNSLVTQCQGCYEPGAYDIRHDPPRATRVADTIRALSRKLPDTSSATLGWWRQPERIIYQGGDVLDDARVSAA